ncbi:hypothetical protein [Leisingera sp. ANG59]|uniref:hypothetical protein n=1 Tax=Leisingera sp. ANG59 TaxID=2675221 RepID=UPI00157364C8|nr:hypothetical protein [Leisingera sp. ANG59]NSY37540.1 hypothetical protein [Leisingera sp. ANG59]
MNNENGLSIAAIVLAVLGAITPGVGLYVGWAALALATLAALGGAKGLPIAVVAISAIVFLVLTPSLWVEAAAHKAGFGEATGAPPILRIGSIIALIAPIVGLIVAPSEKRRE